MIFESKSNLNEGLGEGLRRKAKRLVSHRDLEDMLAEIGEMLGFYVKMEESTADGLHRFNITWRDRPSHLPVKVWEVEISGNVLTALARLKHAFDLWHPELYLVVSDAKTKEKAEELVKPIKGAFAEIEITNGNWSRHHNQPLQQFETPQGHHTEANEENTTLTTNTT